MTQTPPELLAPYKAPLVAAARDLLRAAGTDGIAFEIPASVPPCTIVVGVTDRIGQLLRTPSREPMLGGRRAGDPPASPLTWDEPGAGPRSWTILLTSEGHGLVGALGGKFESAHERHERLDVIEAEPVLRQITELQRENAELREKAEQRARATGAELPPLPMPKLDGMFDQQQMRDYARFVLSQQAGAQEGGAS